MKIKRIDMKNFFTPIPTPEANIYYLIWLLNSSVQEKQECYDKVRWFIEKCYFSCDKNAPINIDRIEVVFNDNREIHCMVNDDLLIIRVYMPDSLFSIISNKKSDTRFLYEEDLDKYVEKYQAKDKILVFLETQYIGNILQIEQETPYSVFDLYNYADFLLTEKCDQIDSEMGAYVKNLVDSYLKYNRLEYGKWKTEQNKGFYKDLQFNLKDGEGKYNSEFGDLWYFDVFETEINDVLLYFRLQDNTDKVSIRACFDSVQKKKIDRAAIQDHIVNVTKNLNLSFKLEKQSGRGKCTTLGSFIDPVIKLDSKGVIDKEQTINQLKRFKKVFD